MLPKIYYDASPKGWFCVVDSYGKVHFERVDRLLKTFNLPRTLITNNTSQRAEYGSLLYALTFVKNYDEHILIGDNENVVFQMNGINKVKSLEMRKLYSTTQKYINTRGLDILFDHVLRDSNIAGIKLDDFMKVKK